MTRHVVEVRTDEVTVERLPECRNCVRVLGGGA